MSTSPIPRCLNRRSVLYGRGVVVGGSRKKITDAWGKWLDMNWEWEWYVTLTFRDVVGVRRAENLFQKWLKELEKRSGNDVQYVRCTEWQRYRGVPHYHALMLNLKHVRRLTWMDRWFELAGIARIFPYDRNKGATFYLSKYVTKELGDIRFSDSLEDYTRWSDRPVQLEFS